MSEEIDLVEECKNHDSECENCGHYPLKHFEECLICGSEAFHKYPPRKELLE